MTDCKVVKDEKGQSRKFAFVGFKELSRAQEIKKKYNNTYIGASRVLIDIAKNRDYANQNSGLTKHDSAGKNGVSAKNVNKKYDEYKKIVQEGFKKSWDDVIIAPKIYYNGLAKQKR